MMFGCTLSGFGETDIQGGHHTGKPGKVREFHIGQGVVGEIVVCLWCATAVNDSHKIKITLVLLSKVDMHKMDCPIVPQYSLRSTRRPVCIPLMF